MPLRNPNSFKISSSSALKITQTKKRSSKLGVFTNYISFPSGDPFILLAGVLLVALAIIMNGVAYKKTLQNNREGSTKGILFSIAAGIAMVFFYKYVAASMAPDFALPQAGKLTPYTALFIFSIGVLLSNFLFNTINMYRPFSGEKVSFGDYVKLGNTKLHLIGILGGGDLGCRNVI